MLRPARCRQLSRATAVSPSWKKSWTARAVAALTPGAFIEILEGCPLDGLDGAEMVQQRALAGRSDAGDFVERVLAPARACAWPGARRWRSGAPRRAGAARSRAPGSRGGILNGGWPGLKKVSRPASRSRPLAMPIRAHIAPRRTPTSARACARRLQLPLAAIDEHEIGPGAERHHAYRRRPARLAAPRLAASLRGSSFTSRAKRRCSISRIMP